MLARHRAPSPSTNRSIAVSTARLAAAAALSLGLSLTAAPAAASPRSDPTSGRAVFTGAAVVHPTSLLVNPAILGVDATIGVYVVYLASTLVVDHQQVDRQLGDEAGEVSPDGSLTSLRGSPGGEVSISWHPTERISVGVGLRSAPAETFFDRRDAGYHNAGEQRDLMATFAGALRVSSIFYVGAALSLSRANLKLRFKRDTALEGGSAGLASDCGGAPCGIGNALATETYAVDVAPSSPFTNQNLALTLGIALKLGSDTYLGVTYHTPPGFSVQTSLLGSVEVDLAPRDVPMDDPTDDVDPGKVKGQASVDVSYPASVEAGLRTPLFREYALVAGLRWEDTSRLSGYDVRPHGRQITAAGVPEWIRRARGLSDTVAGWVGVEQYDGGESWRVGGRLGFELASLEDSRVSTSGNSTRSVTVDLGAQWRLRSAPWSLQLSYGLAYFLPVSVDDSAFSAHHTVDCVDSGYDYASEACTAVRAGYGIQTGDGDYQRFQHALRLGARYEF